VSKSETPQSSTVVGVVGLGQIGGSVAKAVAGGGFATAGYDVKPEVLAKVEQGVRQAGSLQELGEVSDIALGAVWDDEQVMDVLGHLLEVPSPPSTIGVISTVTLRTIHRAAEAAEAKRVNVLDCSVTGGARLRRDGKIVVMVGSSAEAFEAIRPVLETFGDPAVHAGPLGSGMRAKLARNMIVYGTWYVVLEAARLAASGDVSVETLAAIVSASDRWKSGAAEVLQWDFLVRNPGDDAAHANREHYVGALHKDLRAAIEAAEDAGVDVDLARFVDERFDALIPIELES
jgi:3-hydroxyisobutyrate dehydrogenase-like beta-hydroxyacid dehydrogenase